MGVQEWLVEFRVLHDKARSGELSDYDAKLYKDGREELAAALVQAQRLTRKPEESAREALRVERTRRGAHAARRDHGDTREASAWRFGRSRDRTAHMREG